MQSKLPLLPSGPGGVRKSTVHGPWHQKCAAPPEAVQGESGRRLGACRFLENHRFGRDRLRRRRGRGTRKALVSWSFEPVEQAFLCQIKEPKNASLNNQKAESQQI